MIGNSVEQFKEQVKKGFVSCREDITELQKQNSLQRDLLQSLIKQINSKDELIDKLNEKIKNFEKTQELILEKINFISLNKSKITEKQEIDDNLYDELYPNKKLNPNLRLNESHKNISTNNSNKYSKDPYEALLEFKAKANKKEVIKQKILTTIPNEGINSSELCFLFVEHFKYCSKATFYNYLKELEFSNQIRTQRENSKNMIYIQGTMNIPEKKLQSFT